eukprot:13662-Eustigmatos_ZCMA.PRE.1
MVRVFGWEPSPAFVLEEVMLNAKRLLVRRGTYVRTIGAWKVYRDCASQFPFYVKDGDDRSLVTRTPGACKWDAVIGMSTLVGPMGEHDEWDMWRTSDGDLFFRSNVNMSVATAEARQRVFGVVTANSASVTASD